MPTAAAHPDWIQALRGFTERNAGRLTRLEIDDPEIGAQWGEVDLPLRGVAYDPRDERVEMMLGDLGSIDIHLTHSIQGVTSLDVLRDEDGRDRVLRVVHGGAQTLLRFV